MAKHSVAYRARRKRQRDRRKGRVKCWVCGAGTRCPNGICDACDIPF